MSLKNSQGRFETPTKSFNKIVNTQNMLNRSSAYKSNSKSLGKLSNKSMIRQQRSSPCLALTCYREDCYEHNLQKDIKQINSKRDRMYASLSLFELMKSNDMSSRCLLHNNQLTLYCLTERKVLCANCIFGINKHRMHRILPVLQCSQYIIEDNQVLSNTLRRDLQGLDESIRICKQNIATVDIQLSKYIKKLDSEYRKEVDLLRVRYDEQTLRIKQLFTRILNKSHRLKQSVEEFKSKIVQTLSRIDFSNSSYDKSQTNIMRQIIYVNICENSHFIAKKLTNGQIQHLVFRTCQ